MARKVFISFLGTANYQSCKYVSDGFVSEEVRYVQVATLDYLIAKKGFGANDVAIILLTERVMSKNWEDDGHIDRDTKETIIQDGLCKTLEKKKYPFECRPIFNIPNGNNEAEIWDIFNKVYGQIEEGDELYFDITHGFRYLPMLTLVLGNYSKFLKNTTVGGITYGNFESRTKATNEAPIIDLQNIIELEELIITANDYKQFGKMEQLTSLLNNERDKLAKNSTKSNNTKKQKIDLLKKKINGFEAMLATCKGRQLIEGKEIIAIKECIKETVNCDFSSPMKEILKSLEKEIKSFKENNIDNLWYAIELCIKYGMVQQAYTLTQESIVSVVCDTLEGCYPDGLITKDEPAMYNIGARDYISSILGLNGKDFKKEANWKNNLKRYSIFSKELFALDWVVELRKAYAKLITPRNNMNHAGFLKIDDPKSLITNLNKVLAERRMIFEKELKKPVIANINPPLPSTQEDPKSPLLINLSNHPFDKWGEQQKLAALEYGDCIDLPFPNVDPTYDAVAIENLADTYVLKIKEMSKGFLPTVHLMGEMNLTFQLVKKLQVEGIKCIASTTERMVTEMEPGRRETHFKFIQFRVY